MRELIRHRVVVEKATGDIVRVLNRSDKNDWIYIYNDFNKAFTEGTHLDIEFNTLYDEVDKEPTRDEKLYLVSKHQDFILDNWDNLLRAL